MMRRSYKSQRDEDAEDGRSEDEHDTAADVTHPSPRDRFPEVETARDEAPKVIMSKAQRRKLNRPVVTVTAEMKEAAREEKRELRKHLRMLKSNGARRKVAKLREKREREENENEEAARAFDSDYRPRKKGRRLG